MNFRLSSVIGVGALLGVSYCIDANGNVTSEFARESVQLSAQERNTGAASVGDPRAPVRILMLADYASSAQQEVLYDFILPRVLKEYVELGVVQLTVAPIFLNSGYARSVECIDEEQQFDRIVAINSDREIQTPFAGSEKEFAKELSQTTALREFAGLTECVTAQKNFKDTGEDLLVNSFFQDNRAPLATRLLVLRNDNSRADHAVSALSVMMPIKRVPRSQIADEYWERLTIAVDAVLAEQQ